MSTTEFEKMYDCQIQYQYSFDGKKKKYYPIISNLHITDATVSLREFDAYPKIDFHSCEFTKVEFVTQRVRDLNFQHCNIQHLTLNIEEFNGTLGFANSSISFTSLVVSNSPKILAVIESVVIGMRTPKITGFDDLHTCAIIDSSLDFLNLNAFLTQINCHQLLLAEIDSNISLEFELPSRLHSLKLRNVNLSSFPNIPIPNQLEQLTMEDLELSKIGHLKTQLKKLEHLREFSLVKIGILQLPDVDLPHLEKIKVDSQISFEEKFLARLKLSGIEINLV